MIRRRPPLLSRRNRRDAPEPVVAMINVVFLLLIFFLMTARIASAPPFDIALPSAEAAAETRSATLFVSAAGDTAFRDLRGPAAVTAAAAEPTLTVQADARLAAGTLAGLIGDLARAGAGDVRLLTRRAR